MDESAFKVPYLQSSRTGGSRCFTDLSHLRDVQWSTERGHIRRKLVCIRIEVQRSIEACGQSPYWSCECDAHLPSREQWNEAISDWRTRRSHSSLEYRPRMHQRIYGRNHFVQLLQSSSPKRRFQPRWEPHRCWN